MSNDQETHLKEFNAASEWVSSAPSAASLPNDVKLELYGLFKYINSSAGPIGGRPSIFSPAPRAKYDSWAFQYTKYSSQSSGQKSACRRYIEIAKQIGWTGNIREYEDEDIDLENLDDDPAEDQRQIQGKSGNDNPIGGVKVSVMSGEDGEQDALSTIHPLHQAVSDNDVSQVEKLIKQNMDDINLRDEFGYTPLHLAADRGYVKMTELLLRLGADKDAKDEDEQTPFMLAEISEREDIMKILRQD
ncbi:uncharacterized protein L201_006295 [Kwoniella dendrophila CBS 6074]|uniref:ACB domain-containing protein n=1 Tax=Kwoniella dendrophila CBS 6074 TaxID=1295534 RepID=A0AAX4K1B3_9TREE